MTIEQSSKVRFDASSGDFTEGTISVYAVKLDHMNQGWLGRFWRRLGRVGYFLAGLNPLEAQRRAHEAYAEATRKLTARNKAYSDPVLYFMAENGMVEYDPASGEYRLTDEEKEAGRRRHIGRVNAANVYNVGKKP